MSSVRYEDDVLILEIDKPAQQQFLAAIIHGGILEMIKTSQQTFGLPPEFVFDNPITDLHELAHMADDILSSAGDDPTVAPVIKDPQLRSCAYCLRLGERRRA